MTDRTKPEVDFPELLKQVAENRGIYSKNNLI